MNDFAQAQRSSSPGHSVALVVRDGCGSCVRVEQQITPICQDFGCEPEILNCSDDPELVLEFGDRVPVVLLDGEEFSAWEVDDQELIDALRAYPNATGE